MLTNIELREIEEALSHLPDRRSGCIDALKIVQKHRRWVSDEALDDLSPVMGMTPADIDGVATFYNLIFREPVGTHVIMLCDSVSCWIMGQVNVLDYLQQKLGIKPGQTTQDGLFTLLPIVCLGHCELAPVMMVDGVIFGNLTAQKIDEILADITRSGGV